MTNVLISQGKSAVRQLIENQLGAVRIGVLVLSIEFSIERLDHPTPLSGPARSSPPRDPRGGVRAPVCLPLPVRTYGLFGAEGAGT